MPSACSRRHQRPEIHSEFKERRAQPMTTQKTTGPGKIQAVLFDMDGVLISTQN